MGKSFSEIVIEGPFLLVKGFLMGFVCREEEPVRYFFHRKAGIKRETLKDILVELFELENVVYLCLEDRVIPEFKKSVKRANPMIGINIRSIRKIKQAEFRFSFEVFNKKMAAEIRKLERSVPEEAELMDYKPIEEEAKKGEGVSGYSMRHRYTFRGCGTVRGDFEGVIDFFLHCNRSIAKEFILTDNVKLKFDDGNS